MNYRMIKNVLGWLLLFEAAFLLLPLITAVIFWEKAFFAFLITVGLCFAVGWLAVWQKPKNTALYAKEGFVIVALSWILLSLFGCLPFVISGAIPNFVDALFEMVSGFTTTGASILTEVESLPRSILIWRSFSHWVGGMGVLVFIMAFLPLSGGRNMHIMKAESPGPSVSKLVPRVKTTALILYSIYGILTLLQIILLLCGGMPVFDAINTAFATAGTGGFSVYNDSLASVPPYCQTVTAVFMIVFAVNFSAYYLLWRRKWREVLFLEVRVFLGIVIAAVAILSLSVWFSSTPADVHTPWDAVRHALFTVGSIISTTGFASTDYNLWPEVCRFVVILLMIIGACAGSTGGGLKVSRTVLLVKGADSEMRRMLHPKQVHKITVDKKTVDEGVVRGAFAFLVAYVALFILSMLLLSLEGTLWGSEKCDLITNFTACAATINNVGPGLGDKIGPTGNYAFFSIPSKLVLIFDMLAGRLELFPMLLLFRPATWKK